jgi:hypothetical protein
MDLDDGFSKLRLDGSTLMDFATGETIPDSSKPALKCLKTVLIENGASEEEAEQLDQPTCRFIPLQLKTLTLYACKNCGKMHDPMKKCSKKAPGRWITTLQNTGWEAAFKAWVRAVHTYHFVFASTNFGARYIEDGG